MLVLRGTARSNKSIISLSSSVLIAKACHLIPTTPYGVVPQKLYNR